MNEAGLVIELMWLTPTEYPNADRRPTLRELQWVQYQLDTAATVQDVIASDKAIRIEVNEGTPIHFLLCDRKGGAAAIEFLGGRMRAYTGQDLPVKALTNSTYEYCLDFLELSGADEAQPSFTKADNSRRRFVYAAKGIEAWDAAPSGRPRGPCLRDPRQVRSPSQQVPHRLRRQGRGHPLPDGVDAPCPHDRLQEVRFLVRHPGQDARHARRSRGRRHRPVPGLCLGGELQPHQEGLLGNGLPEEHARADADDPGQVPGRPALQIGIRRTPPRDGAN
ncbi:MAG: linear amide C-N hydrolase [Marinilabiliales bacterium]|nr:linear amide C-N hydrolase [Marinilabiliales bacterium]